MVSSAINVSEIFSYEASKIWRLERFVPVLFSGQNVLKNRIIYRVSSIL